jgi:hypothetical protein
MVHELLLLLSLLKGREQRKWGVGGRRAKQTHNQKTLTSLGPVGVERKRNQTQAEAVVARQSPPLEKNHLPFVQDHVVCCCPFPAMVSCDL